MPQKYKFISALVNGFIGLAFEGISSYLQHKQQKAFTTGNAHNE